MTIDEAIKEIKERLKLTDYRKQIPEYYEALKMAINALEFQKHHGWRPISEYDEYRDDYVLVKVFEGEYDYLQIAEIRGDGKWHTLSCGDDEIIQSEVRYFFDIHEFDFLQEGINQK